MRRMIRGGLAVLAILSAFMGTGCGAATQQALFRETASCVLSVADSGLGSLGEQHEAIAEEVELARLGIQAGQSALEAWRVSDSPDPIPSWLRWTRDAIAWVGRLVNALAAIGVDVPNWLTALANLASALGTATAQAASDTTVEEILPEGFACPIP